jgi:long-chain acyl-CoA synthetase
MPTFHDTIPRQFLAAVEAFHKPDAFRYKRDGAWVDVSHPDVLARVHALALALRALKLAKNDRVAILSENRLEWAVADLATLSIGAVVVPVYPTLTPANIEYILRDADVRVVFVSTRAQAEKIRGLRARLPVVEHMVAFDADAAGNGTVSFADLVERGRPLAASSDYAALIAGVGPDDWASIIYTSGTTGEPKGAILTHRNFTANVRQCLAVIDLRPTDTCLSFLPLSHVFERTGGFYAMMTAGTTIAYAESLDTVADNLREVRPTVVCSVPRVYEKMYARILDTVDKGPTKKKQLFHWAARAGRAYIAGRLEGRVGIAVRVRHRVADALVLRKLRARVGGRLRYFISGSAPLARDIAEFFHGAGIPILEGYGLTETSPVLAVNTFQHLRLGSVGRPLPGVELRIAGDGEILARGENVMQGYFKKPRETAEAIVEGWFHTGDIGHLDADGFLHITDRKKDLIATAGGKKVAPQPIEGRLKQSKFVSEAVLVGNRRPFISLLIVPNFVRLEAWAAAAGLDASNHAALATAPEVRAHYQKIVDEINADLAQFERIKTFAILEGELSAADGELTPTLKVRRKIVEERYRAQIDAMYGGAPGA